jgi:hypothetical protein
VFLQIFTLKEGFKLVGIPTTSSIEESVSRSVLEIKNSEYKTCELGSRVDVAATNLVHGNPKRSKEAVSTLLLFGCIHPY